MLIRPSSPGRCTPLAGRVPAVGRVLALALVLGGLGACDSANARDSAADRLQADGSASAAARAALDTLSPAAFEVGHVLGAPDAPIAVVEFSDFGCPYCARFARSTLPELRRDFIDTGLVRWRYVPVTFGFAGGQVMAAAAECSAEQGGPDVFWEVHDLFYARQVALQGEGARARALDWLAELGLDRAALDRCMDAPETRALLNRHNEASREWYVRGTPTFLINGAPMSGAMPLEFFQKVFATALDPSGL